MIESETRYPGAPGSDLKATVWVDVELDDIENLRHKPAYDPRGFRWAIVLCVVFWAGIIVGVVRCSHGH